MLTHPQRKLLLYLDSEARAGRYPTYAEMAAFTGAKERSAAFHTVEKLIERGYLVREGKRVCVLPMREGWFQFDDASKQLVELKTRATDDDQVQTAAERGRAAGASKGD